MIDENRYLREMILVLAHDVFMDSRHRGSPRAVYKGLVRSSARGVEELKGCGFGRHDPGWGGRCQAAFTQVARAAADLPPRGSGGGGWRRRRHQMWLTF